jgi:hypothetical protein
MKEGASFYDFKIRLLKILYFRNPVLLNKCIMERMLGICLEVFITVEMYRYPEGMGILWTNLTTDPKVFHSWYSGQFLGCLKKISLCGRTQRVFETEGYSVFHGCQLIRAIRLDVEHQLMLGGYFVRIDDGSTLSHHSFASLIVWA